MTPRYDPLDHGSLPEGRYSRDPVFRQLVDTLHHFIREAKYTPTELREAALLACIHYESYRVRLIYLDKDQFNLSLLKEE